MAFSESTKLEVKQRADFTCCWCLDRRNKVDVHHIILQEEGGSDDADNAAPLCGSCHDLYGNNPVLRKEIRLRRDQWNEMCSQNRRWPIGLDVPLLDFYREQSPANPGYSKGIQFSDREPDNPNSPPLLYLSVAFTKDRRWLGIMANMQFAPLSLGIRVSPRAGQDVLELVRILRAGEGAYILSGPRPELAELAELAESSRFLYDSFRSLDDTFFVWLKDGENGLTINAYTIRTAIIEVRARFSRKVANAFADYLDENLEVG